MARTLADILDDIPANAFVADATTGAVPELFEEPEVEEDFEDEPLPEPEEGEDPLAARRAEEHTGLLVGMDTDASTLTVRIGWMGVSGQVVVETFTYPSIPAFEAGLKYYVEYSETQARNNRLTLGAPRAKM